MDDARFWAEHGTFEATEASLRLHHRLTYIHPFANGNGRLARIAADAVLGRVFDADPVDWAGGHDSQHMRERRSAYITALKAADQEDFTLLMHFAGRRTRSV